MKFNFKKIASVLATTVMLGSTIAFAAAAWPEPFVKNGASQAAVVIGSATSADMVAATSIQDALNAKVTVTDGTVTGEGDKLLLSEKGSLKESLSPTYDAISEVWTSAITDSNLPTLLADGTYLNDKNNEYPYTQKISLGTQLNYSHFADSDYKDKTPSLGFKLPGSTHVLTYTLDWSSNPESAVTGGDLVDIETTNLVLLGKTYYILDADDATRDLTLLDAAESTTVADDGETKTLTVDGKTYDVSVDFVSSTPSARLIVNGETTNSLANGGTQKLKDGAYVGVKEVLYTSKDSGTSKVEFSIGKGKLELLNSAGTVELNDVSVDALNCSVINGSSGGVEKLDKILLSWVTDDEAFIMPDKDLVMPGFGAIKLTMSGLKGTDNAETTVVEPGSDDYMQIKTTIKDGDITLPILGAAAGNGSYSFIGKASDELLATSNGLTLVYDAASGVNEGFVVSWNNSKDAESYYLTASVSRDSTGDRTNRTTIKNKLTGVEICKDLAPSDTCSVGGSIVLTASSINYTSASSRSVTFTIPDTKHSFNRLYTKSGLTIWLPYGNATLNTTTFNSDANRGAISTNLTDLGIAANATLGHTGFLWNLWFAEADKDGTLGAGNLFNMSLDDNSQKVHVGAVGGDGTAYETSSGSKVWESYVLSDLGTKLVHNVPGGTSQSDAEVTYYGETVTPQVYLAAPSVTTTSANSVKVFKDSETASFTDKNLIVVGGACVNTLAAQIIGESAPVCGDAWAAKTGAGVGKYLIQVAASPVNAQKIAVLVAGYEADQTKTAADKVAAEGVDTSTNSAKVYPLSA